RILLHKLASRLEHATEVLGPRLALGGAQNGMADFLCTQLQRLCTKSEPSIGLAGGELLISLFAVTPDTPVNVLLGIHSAVSDHASYEQVFERASHSNYHCLTLEIADSSHFFGGKQLIAACVDTR